MWRRWNFHVKSKMMVYTHQRLLLATQFVVAVANQYKVDRRDVMPELGSNRFGSVLWRRFDRAFTIRASNKSESRLSDADSDGAMKKAAVAQALHSDHHHEDKIKSAHDHQADSGCVGWWCRWMRCFTRWPLMLTLLLLLCTRIRHIRSVICK